MLFFLNKDIYIWKNNLSKMLVKYILTNLTWGFKFLVSSINASRFKMIRGEYKVRLVFKHGACTSLTLCQSSVLHKGIIWMTRIRFVSKIS